MSVNTNPSQSPTPNKSGVQSSRPIGAAASRGFVWLAMNTVGQKCITFFGQIVLAWLLLKDHYDLIGLAYTVTMIVGQIRRAGMGEVLVHRHRSFELWAIPAFWLSVSLGSLSALIVLGATPVAVWFYQRPDLAPILMVLAIGIPFDAACAVPHAKLSNELRFRTLAIAGFFVIAAMMGMTISFALAGFGAMSFALANSVTAVIRLIVLWRASRLRVTFQPRWRRWRNLISSGGLVIIAQIGMVLTIQGDYIVLGRYYQAADVGVYYFAYNMASQVTFLLDGNLRTILLPSFSKMRLDPARQLDAFKRSMSALALIGVPACFLQAIAAKPGFEILFPQRWEPAIPFVQILSIGMIGRLIRSSGISLLMAQGRFRTNMICAWVYAVLFMIIVTCSAVWGSPLLVAITVSICFAIYGPTMMYIAIKPIGGTWYHVLKAFIGPILAATTCALLAWAAAQQIGEIPGRAWWQLMTTCSVLVVVYIPLIRLLARPTYDDLVARLKQMYKRKIKTQESSPTQS